jgi:hypothetical protein
MSVSKKHLKDKTLRSKTVDLYKTTLLTITQVAEKLNITAHTAQAILVEDIPKEELRKLKSLKYSESKRGSKNPMKGKFENQHHNYKGDCSDGRGYLTRIVDQKRYFTHHVVMAQMLGIHPSRLANFHIHHIDENKSNNSPDNLALVTPIGHKACHERYLKSQNQLELKGLSLAEAIQYMTSR